MLVKVTSSYSVHKSQINVVGTVFSNKIAALNATLNNNSKLTSESTNTAVWPELKQHSAHS